MFEYLNVKKAADSLFNGQHTFEEVNKTLSLKRYLNLGVDGPLYKVLGHEDLLIKHYSNEPDTERLLVLREVSEKLYNWVAADSELLKHMLVFAPIAVGDDFTVRYRIQGELSIADIAQLGPDRGEVARLSELILTRLAVTANTSDRLAVLEIVKDTLNSSNGGVFFSNKDSRLIFGDLTVSRENLNSYVSATTDLELGVTLLNSRFSIGHRPKKISFQNFRQQGVTHVVTVLGKNEGAEEIGSLAKSESLNWIWIPLDSGKVPVTDFNVAAMHKGLKDVLEVIKADSSISTIYLHCSAGIHRTGMFTYALLRKLNYSPQQALIQLERLRAHTSEGVGKHRIQWVEENLSLL